MQMVNITIRVLSKPDQTQLRWIFRTLGKDYDERVLPSIVNEVSKAVVVRAWRRQGWRAAVVRLTPPPTPQNSKSVHTHIHMPNQSPPGQVQRRGAADEARGCLGADPLPAREARARVPHRAGRLVVVLVWCFVVVVCVDHRATDLNHSRHPPQTCPSRT